MRANDFERKVEIMELSRSGNDWAWTTARETWANIKRHGSRGVFSPTAVSGTIEDFTVRRQSVSQANAVRMDGELRLIRSVEPGENRHLMVLQTAIVKSVVAQLSVAQYGLNAMNNPVLGEPTVYSFPAWVAEKYIKVSEETPQTAVETRLVLMTPKAVREMSVGDLVTIDGKEYAVKACHLLDEWRSDYEIVERSEA